MLAGTWNDKAFLEGEIAAWKRSPRRRAQLDGERYYVGEHDILRRERTVIGEGGRATPVDNLPNFRVVDNQYARMVDQKVNYLLGKPPAFDCGDTGYAKALLEIFDNRFWRAFRALGEDALSGGIAWMYIYYDGQGRLCFRRFAGYEILPFWKNSDHSVLDAAVRLYEVEGYEEGTLGVREYVEVYTPDGVYRYRLQGASLVAESPFYLPYAVAVFPDTERDDRAPSCGLENCDPLCWTRIPLVAFKYNSRELPVLGRIRSLQDGINLIASTFENSMMEDARNTILVLVNYDGENLGEFRRNLAAYGAVKVRSTADAPGGDLKTLSVEVNADNYCAILSLFKRALVENARGFDAHDERLSGNPNQMNIQSVYSDIDLDANGIEAEFQAGFEELLWFVRAHLRNAGYGDFSGCRVRVVFHRDMPVNAGELTDRCVASAGLVSRRTLLAHHPFVTDPEAELVALEAEKDIICEI